MRALTRLALAVRLGLVVLAVLAPPTAAGTADAPGATQLGESAVDPQMVVMQFDTRPDGSAQARVEYRILLDDANRTAAFDRLRNRVAANRSAYLDRFRERMRATARTAENATGREMAVANVSVRTTVEQLPRSTGIVVYTFTWEGFAATDGDRLLVGDALGGLYLDNDTRLLLTWPEHYDATTVAGSAQAEREHAAVWQGPRYFGPAGPRAVLQPAGIGAALPVSFPVLAGVVGLLLLGGGAIWWRRRGRRLPGTGSPMGSKTPQTADRRANAAGGPVPSETDASEFAGQPTGTEDAGGVGGAAGGAGAPGDSGDDSGDAGDDEDQQRTDPALLSNEERVIQLLERHDGRLKQQAIVGELDWSEAKVSRVLGTLRDEDRVETFRIGNENVVSLPGEGLS